MWVFLLLVLLLQGCGSKREGVEALRGTVPVHEFIKGDAPFKSKAGKTKEVRKGGERDEDEDFRF